MRRGYVYILANKPFGTIYTGVTNNLPKRVFEHREGIASEFTTRYQVTKLVWWEEHATVVAAIQRETSIKRWKRDWKIDLINAHNPTWDDLYESGGLP
jgi:putative endonuclease